MVFIDKDLLFIIKSINFMEVYYSSDVMSKAEIKRTHKIIYKKLTLDKLNYKVSDSPYGKIDFKSVEIAREDRQLKILEKEISEQNIPQLLSYTSDIA
jgi:hypothetical protein